VRSRQGGDSIGALVSPASTLEEMFLLAQMTRALGSDHIDFRLRQTDFSADAVRRGAPWLGMPVAALNRLDRVLLVGSFLRKDHPLMAVRLRDAVGHGCQLSVVHAVDDDPLMNVAHRAITAPSGWTVQLAQIASAVAQIKGLAAPADVKPGEIARKIADSLCSGANSAVLLGNARSSIRRRRRSVPGRNGSPKRSGPGWGCWGRAPTASAVTLPAPGRCAGG